MASNIPPLPPGFTLDSKSDGLPPLPAGFKLDGPQSNAPSTGLRSDGAPLLPGEAGYDNTPSPEPSAFRGVKEYFTGLNEAAGRLNRAPDTAGLGTLEALGTLATGGFAAPILGTAESIALGTDPEKSFARYTYQPRTESGKAQLGLLGAVARPITESGADVALAPMFAGESRVIAQNPVKIARDAYRARRAGNAIPDKPVGVDTPVVGGKEVPLVKAGSPRQAGLEQVPQADPVKRAINAGFRLKPSETGAKTGAVVEGLTGSAKLETSLAKKNQLNTDRLAREEFGLPEGPITPDVIAQKRQPYNAVYKEVSKLGDVPVGDEFRAEISAIGRTPGKSFQKDINKSVEELKAAYADEKSFNAADAVLKVRELRYKSGKNIGSRDPAQQEIGYAQRAIADAIDNQLERHAGTVGKTDLVARYRTARQELAKLHSLDIATRGGEVSAPILAKQMERGVPLSGNLRIIAQSASDFPNVMREGRKVKGNTPVNMTETAVGLIGGATINPAMLAAMAVRPATRAVLASQRYQNSLVKTRAKNVLAEAAKESEKRNALLEY